MEELFKKTIEDLTWEDMLRLKGYEGQELHRPIIIGGSLSGSSFRSLDQKASLEIFPEEDKNIGIVLKDSAGAVVFKGIIDGTDEGDVIIGDYTGNKGLKWDKSAATFNVKGILSVLGGSSGIANLSDAGALAVKDAVNLGTDVQDSNSNSVTDNDVLNIIRSETAGEAINASTTPQAVYKDTTDGKIYLTDANDSSLGHRRFYGFVADSQNLALSATGYVRIQGKVAGFTGLTSGQFIYLSDTPGAISHTASTTMVIRAGIATSATEVLVIAKGQKMILGSASVNSTADLTTTMTLGFKPKIILCVCIASSSGAAHSFFGTGFWFDSSGQMWS